MAAQLLAPATVIEHLRESILNKRMSCTGVFMNYSPRVHATNMLLVHVYLTAVSHCSAIQKDIVVTVFKAISTTLKFMASSVLNVHQSLLPL